MERAEGNRTTNYIIWCRWTRTKTFKYLVARGIDPAYFCETELDKNYKIFDIEVLSYSKLREMFENYILLISVLPRKAKEIIKYLEENG